MMRIEDLFPEGGDFSETEIKVSHYRDHFVIKWTEQYRAPDLSYELLRKLAEHFGTEKIDVEDYSSSGCETCDYGSAYGHEIQVFGATKNIPEETP